MWHVHAFTNWLASIGSQNFLGKYPRPEAKGETQYLFIPPRSPGLGCVVMVHGTGNDLMFCQTHLFREWHEQGLGIFTFDLDGHGTTSSTVLRASAWPNMLSVARNKLRELAPYEPIHAVGYSLGGALLLHEILQGEWNIASAAVIGTPVELTVTARFLFRELMLPFYPGFRHQLLNYEFRDLIPAIGPVNRRKYPIRYEARGHYVEVVRQIFREIMQRIADRQSQVPTLLVHAALDLLAPPAAGEFFMKFLPRSTLHIVPAENHCSVLMSESTVQVVSAWLRNQTLNGESKP